MSDQMTDQQSNPKAPAIELLDAEELVQQHLGAIPALQPEVGTVAIVMGAYAEQTEAQSLGLPAEEVLSNVLTFMGKTPKDIISACITLNRVVTQLSVGVATRFKELTGATLQPEQLDIVERYRVERDEQRSKDREARDLLVKADAIITKLGLQDLHAMRRQRMVSAPKKQGGFIAAINTFALNNGLAKRKSETSPEAPLPVVGWETPPILSMEDPNFAKLVELLDRVNALINRYSKFDNMKDLVLKKIKNLQKEVAELEHDLEMAKELATNQIQQSEQILARAKGDYESFTNEIRAIEDLKAVYTAVLKYFMDATAGDKPAQ